MAFGTERNTSITCGVEEAPITDMSEAVTPFVLVECAGLDIWLASCAVLSSHLSSVAKIFVLFQYVVWLLYNVWHVIAEIKRLSAKVV